MIEFLALLAATIAVYLLTVPLVLNVFEALRRKAAGEPGASLWGVVRESIQAFRSGEK